MDLIFYLTLLLSRGKADQYGAFAKRVCCFVSAIKLFLMSKPQGNKVKIGIEWKQKNVSIEII